MRGDGAVFKAVPRWPKHETGRHSRYHRSMPKQVQLRGGKWSVGKRIGDVSGFGKVFEATAEDGTGGVVKMIPKQPGASRELLFEDLAGVPNVVPIVDSGETKDAWVIAMPRAERSLRSELESVGGSMTVEQALPILVHIARALAGLDGRVVHRDLKPENVLLLAGAWSLADFGIAKYAEASTAPETWKGAWTAAYAAPERWRYITATGAVDVYSLGILAYELLVGELPYKGPSADEYREQHLHQDSPEMEGIPPALASLIAECLLKSAGARPTAPQLLARLERILQPASPGAHRLQAANQAVQAVNAKEQARASVEMSEAERRNSLFQAARSTLEAISRQLRQAIDDNAPAADATRVREFQEWSRRLGSATIGMDPAALCDPASWSNWRPEFDVIAFAEVGIVIPEDMHGYQGRGHSLYYCDAQSVDVYRWYETAFMVMPMIPRRTAIDPVPFPPGENAGQALSRTIAEWQVAWPFTPIDQGEQVAFIERWLDWFGLAASGQLRHASRMPERPVQGSYRD